MDNPEHQDPENDGRPAPTEGGCALSPPAAGDHAAGNDVSVVGIRLQGQARVQQFAARDVDFEIGDLVMVKGERGLEVAEVAQATTRSRRGCGLSCMRPVLRNATDDDVRAWSETRSAETEAYEWCRHRIGERAMPMRLVRVEESAESHKLTFLFTAEGRIDFRDLVRELAQKFRTRIEMRQIGVRDEAAAGGGYGPCGRSLCCSSFLKGFAPISIKMAKAQKLSLNPSKLSGMCGRLKCCLRYEYDAPGGEATLPPEDEPLPPGPAEPAVDAGAPA
jgi:cell fate regulator YaaT (PSP1 superfamily)